jgi:hypothetical protein
MQNLAEFGGLPVVDFLALDMDGFEFPGVSDPSQLAGHVEQQEAAKSDPGAYAWRLRIVSFDPQEQFTPYFDRFLTAVDTEPITALVIGITECSSEEPGFWEARDLLVEHRDRFPNLRSLFLGDVVGEECEVSWMSQTDLGPLLGAFPDLTELAARGTGDHHSRPDRPVPSETALHLLLPEHRALRSLTVQGGGLPGLVCRELDTTRLPALEHLELWLGAAEYGGDSIPADLARTLSGEAFPQLRRLGVRNAEATDTWVAALAEAPVTARLETLDLSLGTLSDTGALILLDAPVFHGLKQLDLHHHYLSEDMQQRLSAALTASGVAHDLSDRREPHVWDEEERYYPSVSE